MTVAIAWGVAACGAAGSGDPALGPALTLAQAGGSRPTVAVDPRTGTVFVAWIGTSAGESNVYLARYEPGSGPAVAPVRVNHIPGDAAPHDQAPAQVALGPEGHVYVLWQNNTRIEGRRFPASDLRFARSVDGGKSFEPAITVNDDAGDVPSSHTFHDLAVAADGTIFVSWIDSRERDRRSVAMPRHHGEGEDGLPGPEIRIARSLDGGRSFGPSAVVDREACPCCRTAVAIGPDGSVYVAWRKVYDGNVRDVVVARADPGASVFEPPVRVHADGWSLDACPHAGPALAFDAAGRLHVAWYTGREGRQGLHHAVSEDGGRSFAAPTPVLARGPVPPSQVRLAADSGSGVWLAWEDRSGDVGRVVLAAAGAGGPSRFRREAVPGASPALAAAGGTLALAWLDGEAVRLAIRH